MPIANKFGVTAFSMALAGLVAGVPEGNVKATPYRNAVLPQINTVTITGYGADADAVSLLITMPSGEVITLGPVTRAAGVPADDEAAAAALVALVNARAALRGVVVATNVLGVLTLTFQHPNIYYPVSTTVVACVATVATTQTAGGTAIPIGRFIKRGTMAGGTPVGRAAPAIAPLVSTDTQAVVSAVLARTNMQINPESPLSSAVDVIPVGTMADGVYEGLIPMRNAGGGTASAGGQIHVVVSTSGGNEIGEARAAADGATAEVWTMTPTAAELDFLLEVEWTQTNGQIQRTILQSANPDGSATATEICDGWRAALVRAQADGKLTGFTGGGTATFTLTGPAGQSFVVYDLGEGASANVETTPAVIYTVPLDLARGCWHDEVPAGSVGRVSLRLA
jgi:hypothetical protein